MVKTLIKTGAIVLVAALALTVAVMAVELRTAEEIEDAAMETESVAERCAAEPSGGIGREFLPICEEPALIVSEVGYTAYAFELELCAEIVELEAGGESAECRRRVAEVIFNRLASGIWGDSLIDVIYAENDLGYEFETVHYIGDAEVSEETREIVWDVFQNGVEIPARVMFFRTGTYHAWDGAVNEFEVDGVFFSSSVWCE